MEEELIKQPGSPFENTPETAESSSGAEQPEAISEPQLAGNGNRVLSVLRTVVAPQIVEFGGRDDIPWINIPANQLGEIAQTCKDHEDLQMNMLHCLLAVDYQDYIEVVYILFSLILDHKLMLKVNLPMSDPDAKLKLESVSIIWGAAEWDERETHDLFGVEFDGNPNLKPLLLYDGFEGFPGRKNFPMPVYKEY